MTTATTPATYYAAAVATIADDIVRQLEDGAPYVRHASLAAGGHYFEAVRVYYVDLPARCHPDIPAGVARIALDVSPSNRRRPAHEVRVCFDSPAAIAIHAADDIAHAVLDQIGSAADYPL